MAVVANPLFQFILLRWYYPATCLVPFPLLKVVFLKRGRVGLFGDILQLPA